MTLQEKHAKLKIATHDEVLPTTFVKPKIKHFGKKKHWKMGDGKIKLGGDLQLDSDWTDIIEQIEFIPQNLYCETMDCYSWNVIEVIRILAQMLFQDGAEKYSRRFSNVLSNGGPSGGMITDGLEQPRKSGLLPESSLPWTANQNTWSKFHSPVPMPNNLVTEALKWLRKYSYAYDWVVYPSIFGKSKTKAKGSIQDAIFNALKNSPCVAAVEAWYVNPNTGLCYSPTGSFNHLSVISGAVYGQYFMFHDSYTNCWRKVDWNYPFKYVARISLSLSDKPRIDADYIINSMFGKNVKGDVKNTIYFIWNGYKLPYPSGDEYNKICDKWFGTRDFITVSQDAIDLITEGNPMLYDNIESVKPYFTIQDSVKK